MSIPPQRPGQPGRRRPVPPPDPETRRLPRPTRHEPPTEQFRARHQPADAATEKIARPRPPAGNPPGGGGRTPPAAPPPAAPSPSVRSRRRPLSILLIGIIVLALVAAGLAGAELYARHRAGTILADVTQCVVQDGATISFGVSPPFLWQHITGHYTNISVQTAGNQVQEAEGMTADVTLTDIRLQSSGDSKGTIGSLDATLAWTSAGIKDTVAANLPGVGSLVSGVRTDAAAGTIVLEAVGDTSVTAAPEVTDGNLGLRVLDVTGPFAKDTV
ncbi:LmeA family phospholipid-binding protein [[Mycobacterium] appelbergii]|uniref:LmeA family phospholipid-binding protein n=1 Tax=[Mycobacterium] appelbergii TaxID=2939269 RepID=UPI0029393426|nr:LmeA family phospholipid-binding protein [Mycobacterium sp. 21AC1]